MSGYSNMNEGDLFWNPQGETHQSPNPYYETDYGNIQNQHLDFQTFGDGPFDPNQQYFGSQQHSSKTFMESLPAEIYTPVTDFENSTEYDEPPLLEELEIYPDRIFEKTLAVFNPFRSHGLADDADFLTKDTDLAGPVAFCLMLAVCLFISGNKAHFGYIYGLSVVSCILMYCLLTLMTSSSGVFTLSGVASILGYCLLPIVLLSVVGIFASLKGPLGIMLSLLAVLWSSLSASRLFVAVSGDHEQRPLVAYPCGLVCGVFALLVVF